MASAPCGLPPLPSASFDLHELRWFMAAIDASPELIHITDMAALRLIYVNQTALNLSGFSREEYLALRPHELLRLPQEEVDAVYRQAIEAGEAGITLAPQLIADKEGKRRAWWESHHRAFEFDGRWLLSSVSIDVTRQVLAERGLLQAKRMYAALSASTEAILNIRSSQQLFDSVCQGAVEIGGFLKVAILMAQEDGGDLQLAAEAGAAALEGAELTPWGAASAGDKDSLINKAYLKALPCVSTDFLSDPRTAAWHSQAAAAGVKASAAIPIMRGHSAIGVLLVFAAQRRTFDEETIELLQRIAQNITIALLNIDHEAERERAEERIRYLATHDSLTGVPNRMLFSELLNSNIHSASRQKRRFAVMFLDLDNFKQINDTLGHAAGDQVLIEVSRRLRQALRISDVLARMSGDEFVAQLQDIDFPRKAAEVARKMLAAINEPIAINGQQVRISASIGIALYPADGEDEKTLMQRADSAMYAAKDDGKDGLRFYSAADAIVGESVTS